MLVIVEASRWEQDGFFEIARGIKKRKSGYAFERVISMKKERKRYKEKLNDAAWSNFLCHHNIMHLRARM